MTKNFEYTTKGTCSRAIRITLEDGIVAEAVFVGGCPGNTTGVSALVKGMSAEEAIRRLRGIRCGSKPTSCPDQLANALEMALKD